MQIYNVVEGKHDKTHLSQKYGCNHAMFAHAKGCIIHSSTKINSTYYPWQVFYMYTNSSRHHKILIHT
jgi:hypothetical protein